MTNIISIAITGPPGVGKTAYIHRLTTGEYIENPVASNGEIQESNLTVETKDGSVHIKIVEVPIARYIESTSLKPPSVDYTIALFDVTSRTSFEYLTTLLDVIKPVVVCASKLERDTCSERIYNAPNRINREECSYIGISSKDSSSTLKSPIHHVINLEIDFDVEFV